MRAQIVAGNWKMNCDLKETKALLSDLKSEIKNLDNGVQLMVAPPFTNLLTAVESLKDVQVAVAAQDMHPKESEAYTGEISAKMLKSIGVETVILGHSERRKYFGETKAILNDKVKTALKNGFTVYF